jgi:4-hydroxyphenylpyruvate dioxygenase-like putative hemolysin
MLKRAEVKGVEFIEFAASGEDASVLGAILSGLGFVPTASQRALRAALI